MKTIEKLRALHGQATTLTGMTWIERAQATAQILDALPALLDRLEAAEAVIHLARYEKGQHPDIARWRAAVEASEALGDER